MDLEPLDESINPQNQGNTSRMASEIRLNPLDQKALTSTASAQRTQQSAFKSLSKETEVVCSIQILNANFFKIKSRWKTASDFSITSE